MAATRVPPRADEGTVVLGATGGGALVAGAAVVVIAVVIVVGLVALGFFVVVFLVAAQVGEDAEVAANSATSTTVNDLRIVGRRDA